MKEKTRFVTRRFYLALAGLLFAVAAFAPIEVKAENATDPAPYVEPDQANGDSILFDNTHGQTAGAADWVIDGAFSDYADGLADSGYYVKELRKSTVITYDDLKDYDVFIIPEANIPYKTTEQEAILTYVDNGGSVFFIADHYNADRNKNRWDAAEIFNGYRRGAYADPTLGMSSEEASSEAMSSVVGSDWLAENFGVRFRYNAIGDVNATNIVDADDCFGITEGVSAVAMHAGSTIAILDNTAAKGIEYLPDGLTDSDKWSNAVDEGVYNSGGVEEGAYVAIAKAGLGKAAFIGDSSAVEDATPKYTKEETGGSKTTYDGYEEEDDAALLVQLTDWLAEQEDYTSFENTGISLSQETILYDFETPEASTEPEEEPWTSPKDGYKWYDASTFKSGSYGYEGSGEETEEDNYVFSTPETIIAGQELLLTVYFANLSANTIYEGFKVGAYLSGGTQIGLFADVNGEFPSSYGYSAPFSITTDSGGCASKTFLFKLNESASGTFYLRLKQSSSILLTETLSISENTDTDD